MIKKFKSSLFAKVFVITGVLLLIISLLVFGLLAVLMPQTYSNKLNSVLEQQTQSFLVELEQKTFQEAGGLFDQFLQNSNITDVELYDDAGQQISVPTKQPIETSASEMATESAEDAPILSNSFYFSFADSNIKYMLVVYGEATQIAELQKSFIRIFPVVLIIIIVIAFFASLLFSRVITSPVLRISNIANKMSDMQFDWKLDEKRSDELGVLEKSLNTMSQNLSNTLSDLKNANAKLEADIEHEKALEQAQRDFFSAASHELKTPITIIKGQLEGMILGIGAYKDREKYLSRSLEVANTLENMVQELLTISRLQTPNTEFKVKRFVCAPVIKQYLRETEDLIVNKDLQISCNVPEDITIKGNKILIEKVFSNIIGNAIKYSPKGATIDIMAYKHQEKYLFCIENSGTHISEDTIPKLFKAFYRVEQSRSRKTGGSGLGLYIVQKILQQHDSCCYASNTKTGVQFSFELPS